MGKEKTVFDRTVAEAIRQATLLFAPRRGNQSQSGNASPTQSGLVPPVPADATEFLNGASPPAFAQVKDSDLSTSDVPNNNVSITKHGFAPKAPNDATKYLDGTGAWSAPAGGGGGGAPALGTFPSITGLVLRLSAELSTMTRQTDNRVSSISDLSGSGWTFTAAGSVRPRWYKRGYNRIRPAIVFDGSASKITSTTAFALAQPFTVVVVLEDWGRTGATNLNLFRDAGNNAVVFISTGQWAMFAGGSSVLSAALMNQNQESRILGSEGAPAIMQAAFNGASSVLANNGVEITGNPGTTQGITGALTIGGDATTSFARFNLYEFLIFNKALSPTERAQLNAYYAAACEIQL